MSEIIFTNMKIENYSCIASADIPLNGVGLCSIEGRVFGNEEFQNGTTSTEKILYGASKSNGAGKSSIIEAFYAGLTGEFFDFNTTMTSCVYRFANNPAHIIIEGFKTPDDIPFKIDRTFEPRSKRADAKVNHVLLFTIAEENIHEKTNSIVQTQERINDFLGINSLLLLNSKIFGQGDISSFTYVNDRQKKIIIDNLVGVGVCDKLYKTSNTMLSDVSSQLTTKGIEVINLKKTEESATYELNTLKKKELDWEVNRQKEIDNYDIKVQNVGIKIDEGMKVITSYDLAKTEVMTVNNGEDLDSKITKVSSLLPTIIEKLTLLNAEMVKIDNQHSFNLGIKQKVYEEIIQLTKLYEAKKSTCPTCLRELNKQDYTTIKDKLNSELKEVEETLQRHKDDKKEVEKQYNIWNKCKKELDDTITDLKNKLTKSNNSKKKIEELDIKRQKTEALLQSLSEEISRLGEAKLKKLTEVSPYSELITDKEKKIAEIQKEYADIEITISALEKDKKYLTFLNKAFNKDGIPQLISNDVLKVLNKLLKKYKARILGTDFDIEYRMRERGKSEEIYLYVSNPEGGEGYYRQSKGEKRRIDLCQMFAISDFAGLQNKCRINTIWFDEVFSELDAHSCDVVLDIIKEYPASSKFIITHKEIFRDEFKNRIFVEKRNKMSTVSTNY